MAEDFAMASAAEEFADIVEESHPSRPRFPSEIPDSQPDDDQSWSPHLPAEIPDSQPDLDYDLDYDLDDAEPQDEDTSNKSAATELIPGGTKLTARPELQIPLHKEGVNVNGRVPSDAPQYRLEDGEEMEEVATQPATQPFFDSRRHGTNSMLSTQDEGDVIVILHPSSPSAHYAVQLTADAAMQHILQNHHLSHIAESDSESEDTSRGSGSAQDIALRLSSKVHDLGLGFVFGRNPALSDIVVGGRDNANVSNRHFRIYINQNGILMLEDLSTNGTIVNGDFLHGPKWNDQNGVSQPRITIHTGSVIQLPLSRKENGEMAKFIVSIPPRDFGRSKYHQNLFEYLALVQQTNRQAEAAKQAGTNAPMNLPALLNTLPPAFQPETAPNTSALLAATGGNNCGMHWNGGAKYNVVSYVDKGAFAMVYKLSSKRDGEVYAVKQLEKRGFAKDGNLGHKVHNELNVMKKLRHPNIVQYTDHHETATHLFIIMEFIPCGDLKVWTNAGRPMPEYMAVMVASQMLEAIDYLHEEKITHRDIKPDNILMASIDPRVYKLSDFGLSKIVNHDETFLKTFCGTLLYLAPEVYPGYQAVKAGLPPSNKRARKLPARPYMHSVDIWSLGSVLYQLLCGKPPFTGSSDDQGNAMLVTVMTIPVDYERLIYGGVSHEAIHFISKMLVTDPALRADEGELLKDSWLIPKPNAVDQPGGLDASQLSLADPENQSDELEYDNDMKNPRDTKRFRSGDWIGDQDEDLRDEGQILVGAPRNYFEYQNNDPMPDMTGPPPPQRLFGEIGTSALRSSGVLGQNANVALDVAMEGSSDEEYANGSYIDPQDGALGIAIADYADLPDTNFNTPRYEGEGVTEHNLQYPQTLSRPEYPSGAPSLLGAETLVGQLNMASPESGASAPSVDSKPATPKTPISHEFSPTQTGSKRPSQDIQITEEDSVAKRSRTGRATSSHRTPHGSADSHGQHRSSTSKGYVMDAIEDATARKGDATAGAKSKHTSQESNYDDNQDGQQSRERTKSNASLLPTTFNSQDSAHESHAGNNEATSAAGSRRPSALSKSIIPSLGLAPPSGPADENPAFLKPPISFGNLIPTKDSIKTVAKIKITSLGTTYGRAPDCTFKHHDNMETRIAKNAIDIQMWYENMNKDLEAGKADWASNPNLSALISTRTSRYIKINGIRLMRGQGCWEYGKLKTGDIVSVFELAEGQTARNDRDKECLRFRCEFFVGASKEVRKEGEKFVVEKEKEKYNQYRERKSRESSAASEAKGDGSTITSAAGVGAASTTAGQKIDTATTSAGAGAGAGADKN